MNQTSESRASGSGPAPRKRKAAPDAESRTRGASATATAGGARAEATAPSSKRGEPPTATARAGGNGELPAAEGAQYSETTIVTTTTTTTPEGTTVTVERTQPAAQVEQAFDDDTAFEPLLGVQQMDLDDEVVLVDVLHDTYNRLNVTGTFIWRMVAQRRTVGEMANETAAAFDLPEDEARAVVTAFLKDLAQMRAAAPVGRAARHS